MRLFLAIGILLASSGIAAAEEPIQIPHRNIPAVESSALQLPVSWPILRDSAKIFQGPFCRSSTVIPIHPALLRLPKSGSTWIKLSVV